MPPENTPNPSRDARRTFEEAKAELRENWEKAPYLSAWTHLKTGSLYVVRDHALIEADLTPAVIYYKRGADPSERWCRPASEFFDGRFEPGPLPWRIGRIRR